MLYELKALIYVMLPVAFASFFRPRLHEDRLSVAVIAFFVSVLTAGFLIGNYFIFYAVFIMAALLCGRREPMGLKIPAFLPALPASLQITIPFPGLVQLITLGPHEVLGLLVIPQAFKRVPQTRRDVVGLLIVVFVVVTWLLSLRTDDLTFTNWLRAGVFAVISTIVPYFAVRNVFSDRANVAVGMKALLTAIIILSAVGFWSSYLSWDFFRAMPLSEEKFSSSSIRDGALRASATLPSTLFSFLSLSGALLLWVFKAGSTAKMRFWFWLLVLLFIAPLSASRGGMLGGLIAISMFIVFNLRSRNFRQLIYAGAVVGVVLLFGVITRLDFSAFDPYGTFLYRQRLLEAALIKFGEVPFFGDANYQYDPFFEPLIQGQGIIDFVNTYIQIGLNSGLAGLLPFFAIIGFSLTKVLNASRHVDQDALGEYVDARRLGRAIAGILVGYSVMIFTVSTVSYVMPLFFLFCAIAVGYARAVRRPKA